jgi:DNA-binding CsgD family transcriptional regulator/tetratricopeptide (TPR) repeat protein
MPNTRTSKVRRPAAKSRSQHTVTQPMLGRADNLAELLESASNPGSAVVVVGVPGSGRTTLLEGVRAQSEINTVWVAPHPWERFRQFAGLSMMLNAIGDPAMVETIARFQSADPTVDGTLATATELLLLLRSSAREETLVLIDDADKFDENSQLAMTYLAGRLGGTGLRLVMAVTPESTFSAFAGMRSVWISRLDRSQSIEFASSIAPGMDAQTLAMVCDRCGGLPGMIASTIGLLTLGQLQGVAPLALPLYPGPAPLEFNAWEPESVLLMRRLSTAALCSVSAIPGIRDADRDRFERLTSQGVLEIHGKYVSIRDGALRSALYWSMTSKQRKELHLLAAGEEQGHSAALVLWHTDHGDHAPESSGALLTEAGTLFNQGLVDAATELVERALLLSPPLDGLADELLALCNSLMLVSQFGLAQRYLVQCRRAAKDPEQIVECLRLEVTISSLTDQGIDIGAISVYARRFRKDSPRASAELLSFAAVSLANVGEITAARAQIEQAYRTFPAESVEASSVQHWARRYLDGIDGAGDERATNDDADPDVDELAIPVQLMSGRALMFEEHYDEARHTFRSLALSTPERNDVTAWTARVLALSAANEIRSGHFAEASRTITSLTRLTPPQDFRNLLLQAWHEAVVLDSLDAEPLLAEARLRAAQSHQPVLSAQLLALEGSIALMRGDLDDARFRLARAYDSALELRPDFLRVEGDFIEVLARRGEWESARRVTARFADRVAQHPSRWSETVLARSQAIVATDEQLLGEFQRALAIANRNGSQFEVARSRLALAMALERFGHGQRAVEQRQAAEYLFEIMSAAGWLHSVHDTSTTAIAPPVQNSLLSTLTDSELAVLRLMRKGVRNKDIAAALFVSLRTVEVRITQIYRKLEARSRSHLLTLLPADLDQIESF